MIKILVISDIHGDASLINSLWLSHQNFDYFFNLGDSQLMPNDIYPFISVKGNCDYGSDYPLFKRIKTKYGDIYLEHGNHYISEDYIKEKNARVFLCGHTHVHLLKKIDDNHYFANPGSLTRPRDNTLGTYLEIYMDQNNIEFIFKEVNC